MATPEVHRSGHTPVSPDHAAEVADTRPGASTEPGAGSVPPDNRPGHHPEVEQDKPRRRPPTGGRRSRRRSRAETGADETAAGSDAATFEFAFEPRIRPAALMVGVTPSNARVEIDEGHLTVRFGRWTLRTPVANVAGTQLTGPYTWWKVAGPPHLSMSDGGVTFATTTAGGVCISFHEPVPGLVPGSMIRHPGATVTVRDPGALAAALEEAQLRVLAGAAAP